MILTLQRPPAGAGCPPPSHEAVPVAGAAEPAGKAATRNPVLSQGPVPGTPPCAHGPAPSGAHHAESFRRPDQLRLSAVRQRSEGQGEPGRQESQVSPVPADGP